MHERHRRETAGLYVMSPVGDMSILSGGTKENDLFKEPEEFVDPKPKDNKDLLKEIELLKAENAYLKKLRALVQERIARESKKGLPPSKN